MKILWWHIVVLIKIYRVVYFFHSLSSILKKLYSCLKNKHLIPRKIQKYITDVQNERSPRVLHFQQVFGENLAINLDPEKLMYLLFISLFMYASCRCGTGRSFDAKIVKLGWYILWPCKMGDFEDGICQANRRSILWDSDFLKEPQLA